MATVFFSYSHVDEGLRDQLETQLSLLKRQGVIETWHDRRIGAGLEFDREIDAHIERDDIILLLVSSDFLASEYCYDREMTRAMERHERGEAVVIPVILRACDWHGAPFGKLMATPPDGKPVTLWPDRDQALLEVARAIRAAADRLVPKTAKVEQVEWPRPSETIVTTHDDHGVRSSNLRIAKRFTERDRDVFRHETFDYMAKFFESSLAELVSRNPGIEQSFRRVDANRFTATIYRDGQAAARCTVFMGDGLLGSGIAYASTESVESNAFNESLSVANDDQMLFLRSLGMAQSGRGRLGMKLSMEGAAELYWGMFIERLQRI